MDDSVVLSGPLEADASASPAPASTTSAGNIANPNDDEVKQFVQSRLQRILADMVTQEDVCPGSVAADTSGCSKAGIELSGMSPFRLGWIFGDDDSSFSCGDSISAYSCSTFNTFWSTESTASVDTASAASDVAVKEKESVLGNLLPPFKKEFGSEASANYIPADDDNASGDSGSADDISQPAENSTSKATSKSDDDTEDTVVQLELPAIDTTPASLTEVEGRPIPSSSNATDLVVSDIVKCGESTDQIGKILACALFNPIDDESITLISKDLENIKQSKIVNVISKAFIKKKLDLEGLEIEFCNMENVIEEVSVAGATFKKIKKAKSDPNISVLDAIAEEEESDERADENTSIATSVNDNVDVLLEARDEEDPIDEEESEKNEKSLAGLNHSSSSVKRYPAYEVIVDDEMRTEEDLKLKKSASGRAPLKRRTMKVVKPAIIFDEASQISTKEVKCTATLRTLKKEGLKKKKTRRTNKKHTTKA